MSLLTSLVSLWEANEASGDLLDAHGSNHMTDVNSVGSAAGLINGARDYELSSSQYFTIASNASLQTGDSDWTFTHWVNAESLAAPGANTLSSKHDINGAGTIEHFTRYRSTTNAFDFTVSPDGTAASIARVVASNFGAPSVGNWCFVVVWHDSVNNLIGIQVNNTTPNTLAHSTGVSTNAIPFRIGATANSTPGDFWDGLIDQVGYWDKVLSTDEKTTLYNNGRGLRYPFYAGQQLINGGLLRSPLVNGGLVA